MKTNRRNYARGRVWVVVIVVIAALGCGVAIGFLAGTRGPSAQRIADALAAPLPVPDGAKLLKQYGPDGYSGIQYETGDGYLSWRAGIALDITGMTKVQVEAVPEFYESYFNKALPDELDGVKWITNGIEGMAVQGFTKWPQAPDGWAIVAGGAWTWSRRGRVITRNLFCEVNTEIMHFDPLGNSGLWEKKGVFNLSDPAKGERVMFITLTLRGQYLRNAKGVKWPPKPAKYTPMEL